MSGVDARAWLRAGLWFMTLAQAAIGLWAQLLPEAFFENFPVPGNPWVAMLPGGYNEHLIRDYGGMNLFSALVFGVAAVTLDRRITQTGLVAYLLFGGPHLVFHAGNLEPFGVVSAVTQIVLLTFGVIIPLVLLVLARRLPSGGDRTRQPAGGDRGVSRTAGRS